MINYTWGDYPGTWLGCEYAAPQWTLCLGNDPWFCSQQWVADAFVQKVCPANSLLVDGTCTCNNGYQPDAAGAKCVPAVAEEATCRAGNPVLPGTGRKLHDETDYAGAGTAPLEVRRYYRSLWTDGAAAHGLSPMPAWSGGWKLNWHASLSSPNATEIRAFRPDGRSVAFAAQATTPLTWAAQGGSRDGLTELVDAAGQRTGWSYKAFDDDATETYDAQGRLQSVSARNGWVTTLAYDSAGRLASVRNPFGRQLTLGYDAAGRLDTLSAPGGEITRYGYDANNNLTAVTWPDGNLRRYHYEDTRFPQALTGVTDELGVRIGSYAYDTQGRVTETAKAGGAERITLAYPAADQTVVTDYASGSASSRTYTFANQAGVLRPTAVSAPCSLCGSTAQATAYDTAGNKTREVAHDGTVTFYKVDAKGRETERATYPASYSSATTRPALSHATSVTSTQWHASFNLPRQVAEPGKISAWTYNAKGMLTGASWTATTDATGAQKFAAAKTGSTYATGWGYNASSLNTSIVEKTDGIETQRWTMAYSAAGDLRKIIDATASTSATLTSDSSGRLTQVAAGNGAVATFTPNARGQMVQANTPAGNVSYSIDARSLVTEMRFGNGRWIRYTYSDAHKLLSVSDTTGQSELFAGWKPKGLDPERARRLAQMMRIHGERALAMLVPEARAQGAAALIPAGIALSLFMIAEAQRKNAPDSASAGKCCGQDGPVGSGGEGGTNPSWLSRVGVVLSAQTAAAQSTAQSVFDKAGLLISPKACMPPPGNCGPDKHRQLQDEVDRWCKGTQRACRVGMSRTELLDRLENGRNCAIARDRINKTCFAGGDLEHRDAATDSWRAVVRCEMELGRLP